MINKQNLWFVTLFSMILVLGVYYVTLADESLNIAKITENSSPVISISESDVLTALRVANDESNLELVSMYESILLDNDASLAEKNDAYDNLQNIQDNMSKTEEIQKIIKEKFSLDAFIKIASDQINITIDGNNHDTELANNIIREIQTKYDSQMYITVKFES